ncbi:MAG: OmpA family protein [Rhizobacter sp.]
MSPRHLLAPLVLALAAASALAQDVRVFSASEAVDPREVATILDPSRPAMKMRSIRLLDDSPAAAPSSQVASASGTVRDEAPAERPGHGAKASALSLPVQFAFDSAEILPSARSQLDALAEGIRMLPAVQAVVIEGHTDAIGSEAYNETLSLRRAYAVKSYLVASHRIDPTRLHAVGLGKFQPLPGRDPQAPENRRVQFRGE